MWKYGRSCGVTARPVPNLESQLSGGAITHLCSSETWWSIAYKMSGHQPNQPSSSN